MLHIRCEARLSAPLERSAPESGTMREHYERSVASGGPDAVRARRKLHVPPCPPEVQHLVLWTYDLTGRDGFNMGGPNLLSNREASAFFALRGIIPDPLEIDALFVLNAAYCNPDSGEQEEEGEGPQETVQVPQVQRGREVVAV